jgi:hypothetical protein
LKKHHPNLAHLKVFEGFSHIDFTYGSHHALNSEIVTTLKRFSTLSDIFIAVADDQQIESLEESIRSNML